MITHDLNTCLDCGKVSRGERCRACWHRWIVEEPLYCTCVVPVVNWNDMCLTCSRAHKPTVFARYGWKL